MDAPTLTQRLAELRVVPVVTIDSAADAAGLAGALAAGGLPIAEITFRTDAAAEAIAAIRAAQPDVLVGAGTVLDAATVDRALEAGAEFIVAPGFNPAMVAYALARGVAVIPGVVTPSEIEAALSLGLRVLKFFPAEASGGPGYLSAVRATYPTVRFMPTGGVNIGNLAAYLALPNVIAAGGTWIATADAIKNQRWDEISGLAAEAVRISRGAAH
ncbi:MAG: bifunctional 4-hydroxy-2-oxoglutarate aldolase/2-dehydro-3-deoxy-phosphogluconate aldolase [Chloroflexota bacterium]|nr:bifunctional 4-hydroxy-2-oxoglutarate aldolase/2-dehydro-3-deoxy-phosphogluconate aldolase [Chloroflexota bacterium]